MLDEWLPFKVTKVFRGLTGGVPRVRANALTGLGLVSSTWVRVLFLRDFRLPEGKVSSGTALPNLRASPSLLKRADGCNPILLW